VQLIIKNSGSGSLQEFCLLPFNNEQVYYYRLFTIGIRNGNNGQLLLVPSIWFCEATHCGSVGLVRTSSIMFVVVVVVVV